MATPGRPPTRRTRPPMRFRAAFVCLLVAPLAYSSGSPGDAPGVPEDPAAVEFFEAKVRPVLAEPCQSCHGPDKQKSSLRLDSAVAVRMGGESGPVVMPGDPDKSRLIAAVNYAGDLKMPPKGKLPAE